MNPSRAISTIFLCGALGFTALTALLSTNFDFRAFYCAGYAVRVHASPYHTEPLHACERTRTDGRFAPFFKSVALPAPQPAYDIALFALFAALPFVVASKLWTGLLLLCAFGAIAVMQRLMRTPFAAVFAVFWLSLCITSIYLGEAIPLCLCAVVCAAYFARMQRFELAAIASAATLVEPHIGIPACLSAALWLPRCRPMLAICLAALAAVSIGVLGIAQNAEYVAAVLPAHALSEIGSDAQLSFSALLHGLGVSDAAAVRAGTISYVAVALAGLPLARLSARRFGDAAFVVAVPAALAVVGGVFMHVTEIVAAVPLALLLWSRASAHRALLAAALALLAIPWWSLATPMLFGTTTGVLLAGITFFYVMLSYAPVKAPAAAGAAILAVAAVSAVLRWHDLAAIHTVLTAPPDALRAPYPETSWKWFNDAYMSTGSVPSWLLRGASWAGLCVVVWCACAARTKEAAA